MQNAPDTPPAAAKDPRGSDMPWITPVLTVRDADAAATFYETALGFATTRKLPDPENPARSGHVNMAWKGQPVLMFVPENAWGATAKAPVTLGGEAPDSLYVYVDDVDATYAKALATGGTGLQPPADQFWGDRYALVRDPDGYKWGLATNLAAMKS